MLASLQPRRLLRQFRPVIPCHQRRQTAPCLEPLALSHRSLLLERKRKETKQKQRSTSCWFAREKERK
jgi:hypothetical protein